MLLPPDAPDATRAHRAAVVLRAWDARRSAAWESGDLAALRELYVRDSPAGRADEWMLQRWLDRGLRVEGLRMQLLALSVRSWRDGRIVVDVVDRLVGGTVDGGRPLPVDRATAHTVVLRRVAGEWRVAAVS